MVIICVFGHQRLILPQCMYHDCSVAPTTHSIQPQHVELNAFNNKSTHSFMAIFFPIYSELVVMAHITNCIPVLDVNVNCPAH